MTPVAAATALLFSATTAGLCTELAQALERKRPGSSVYDKNKELKPLPSAVKKRPPVLKRDDPSNFLPVPDRWRIIESVGVKESILDPYNRNPLKGDRPLFGKDWFINLAVISDTVFEPRSFPVPVGVQATRDANDVDLFGGADSWVFNENLIVSLSLIKVIPHSNHLIMSFA